jgi:hypothetical protein
LRINVGGRQIPFRSVLQRRRAGEQEFGEYHLDERIKANMAGEMFLTGFFKRSMKRSVLEALINAPIEELPAQWNQAGYGPVPRLGHLSW